MLLLVLVLVLAGPRMYYFLLPPNPVSDLTLFLARRGALCAARLI